MAAAGFTPIQIYYSTTAAAAPTAGNLASGELAININDGKLFYKDSGGVVQVIADKNALTNVASISFGTTGLTPSTATTGAVTVAGTLAIANGGTGQTTAQSAFNALAPSQTSNSGKYLTTDGTNTSWATVTAGGGITYTKITSNTTVANNQGVIADTTGGSFTVTLPATPATGDQVFIADGGNWATNNLTVGRNGSTIEGVAADWTLNQGGAQAQFVYDGTTWNVYTLYGPQFRGTLQSYKEGVVTVTANTATTSLDLRLGNVFNIDISANTTFTFTNPPASGTLQSATLIIKQDAVGGRTGTFTNSKWTDGTAPTLTTTANQTDVFTFFTVDGGTSYFGTYALANVA